jgi:2-methylcitrate dehydratase PrpD
VNFTADLAARASRPCDDELADHLRMLTAANLAAGMGDLGRKRDLIKALPLSADRSPLEAATLAAILLHARTQDDFFPKGRVHVGAITLAATLALAEEAGDRLLDCLAAGYEVMCLTAESGSSHVQQLGLRPSGIFGPLGAAASAARALGLDNDATANAVGLAAALAGGTNQAWLSGTDEWLFVVGQAARIGVEAALLTRAGVMASDQALEGEAGWMACYLGPESRASLNRTLEDPRPRAPMVAAKLYPVSGIAQLVAHLACSVHEPGGAEPTHVVVRLAEAEVRYPGTLNRGPFRGQADALMSVPFVVACALKHGTVRLSHVESPSAARVEGLLSRIAVVADPGVEEAEAVLEVTRSVGAPVTDKTGADILFPAWGEFARDAAMIAERSEMDRGTVEDVLAALTWERPDAGALRQLLLEDM